MAFWTSIAKVHENRPFKPLYARTQATAQAVELDSAVTAEIFPCMVLARKGDKVVPCDTTMTPAGICGTFAKELEITNSKEVAMWVLGGDALFRCEQFDTTASWSDAAETLATGVAVFLKSNANGLLTLEATATTATTKSVARLISVEAGAIIIAGLL